MKRPTPAQVAADKAAIDAALLRLCAAAKTKTKTKTILPAADPRPEKGPFSHLRAALKVLPADKLAFAGWRGSWLDRLARNDAPAAADALGGRKWKGMNAAEETILAGGTAVLVDAKGELLCLSPAGPGAAVFSVGKTKLTQLGVSVLDFTQRQVAALLGETQLKIEVAASAGAKEMAATRRALDTLRRTQTQATSVEAELVVGASVEGFADAAALVAAMKVARAADLECFYGFGDAENADDVTLKEHPWLVGRSFARILCKATQDDSGKASLALGSLWTAAQVRAISQQIAALSPALDGLSVSKTGPFLVARGGMARASIAVGSRVLATTVDFIEIAPRKLTTGCSLVASCDG